MTKEKTAFKLPQFARILVSIYLTGLLILGLFRLLLFLYAKPEHLSLFKATSLKAFVIGLQFDSVILAYVLAIPLLLLFTQSIGRIKGKFIPVLTTLILCIILPTIVLIVIGDIPYFTFFNNRLTESAFQWMRTPGTVFWMLVGNLAHFIFLLLALVSSIAIIIVLYRYLKRSLPVQEKSSRLLSSVCFLVLGFSCFLGMRGRIASPIRTGDAFYSTEPFLNQVGLNPAFTLMKSLAEKVNLMDNELAIKNTRKFLDISSSIAVSPIARTIHNETQAKKYNVVVVLMESMSANYMETFGNPDHLTPTLDSLVKSSWLFTNAYSAGIHTSNGIFASLYSFPALKRIRPMSAVPAREFSGIPYTLKQNGYHNLFFSTHGFSFDNLGTFIPNNFFDELFTAENYPGDKIIGPFGVPDDFVFQFAVNKINGLSGKQPFFATILTTSNHDPYIIPDYFKSDRKDKASRAVAYADWSINQFLDNVKKQPWFDSTLFVFVADHGLNVGDSPYDMALAYNHIPLFFFGPKILGEPRQFDQFIGQIDIFPSLMHLLNISYTNSTLGVNTFTHPRQYMYFSADSKIGCISKDWFYVYRFGGTESLYNYSISSNVDQAKQQKEELEKMRNYAFSNIQTAEWIIANDKTSLRKRKP